MQTIEKKKKKRKELEDTFVCFDIKHWHSMLIPQILQQHQPETEEILVTCRISEQWTLRCKGEFLNTKKKIFSIWPTTLIYNTFFGCRAP